MKQRLAATLFHVFVPVLISQAQILRRPLAGYIGLEAYSPGNADVFSFTINTASLAELRSASMGIYGERRFLLGELNNYTAVMALPTHAGNFGLEAGYNGFAGYHETKLGLAYARSLGSNIDIGIQFNDRGIIIPGYGKASAISFDAGTIWHVTSQLHAAIHISNPLGGKFGHANAGSTPEEKLPSIYTAGLGYDASDKFYISAAIEKEEDQPVNVNAGLQYKFLPQVLGRMGISTATSMAWIGFGFSWRKIRLDITSGYHPQLGLTPGLLLQFNFR